MWCLRALLLVHVYRAVRLIGVYSMSELILNDCVADFVHRLVQPRKCVLHVLHGDGCFNDEDQLYARCACVLGAASWGRSVRVMFVLVL